MRGSDCQPPAAIVRAPYDEEFAALEQRMDTRVMLELLERLEWLEARVGVVEPDDDSRRTRGRGRGDRGSYRRRLRGSTGQPTECWIRPGSTRPAGNCHSSLMPRP